MDQITGFREKFLFYQNKYRKYFPAAFFVAGFLFDILTLSRIDDWLSIAQQGTYLFIIIWILRFKLMESDGRWTPSGRWARWWIYNNEILHFFLGSLLSAYTLFYFVSSSLATSLLYMVVLFALLIINELPSIQGRGLPLKYALFSICLFSYLFIIVPIAFGFIGLIPFLVSLLLGLGFIFLLFVSYKKIQLQNIDLKKTLLLPPLVVATVLAALYILKLLPPIPLSVQYAGIYHQVEKAKSQSPTGSGETQFILKYDRPFWRFWENGAQTFKAEPNDKLNCFVRVFAPVSFKDQIIFHWLKHGPRGWESTDKIPITITGGRAEGFRGYATKGNFDAGQWRVQIETTDGREIGRIGFDIEKIATQNLVREYRTDIF